MKEAGKYPVRRLNIRETTIVVAKSIRIMDILGLVGKASILFRYADAALC